MKILQIATAAFILTIGIFTACQNDNNAAQGSAGDIPTDNPAVIPGNLQEGQGVISQDGQNPKVVTVPAADQAALAEPAQNAAGVWHYTCPKGCAGGGGMASPCATCGTTMTHNTAYHANDGAPKPGNPATATQAAPTMAAPAQKPEPAQNAAGVWHYTCPGGCSGGAGMASPCAKCGKTLTHNGEYHK